MSDESVRIRRAEPADAAAMAAVYDHEVATSIATFDLDPPGPDRWVPKVASTARGDHCLVAERTTADRVEVVGFAYSGEHRSRPGYRHTREVTVYLAEGARGLGLGRRLYAELIPLMAADGVHLALAGIARPNDASEALHRACGFTHVGTFSGIGRKFDTWIDTAWYQLVLPQDA